MADILKKTVTREAFDYYCANQDRIVSGHIGEFVVIQKNQVKGYYGSGNEAFLAMKDEKLGTFIVHKCQEKGTDIAHYYNNAVAFA